MNRISRGEGWQKRGIKYNVHKTSLPYVKFALNCQNVNHIISVLLLINLINSLTFGYSEGLIAYVFLIKNLTQSIISV